MILLYFSGGHPGAMEIEPKYEEFRSRTIWSLSNAFTVAFEEVDPIPLFKATAKLGKFLEARFCSRSD